MSTHKIITANSNNLDFIADSSINLIVTSPPYPMIEMWDVIFSSNNTDITKNLLQQNGDAAFYKMHALLNEVWVECDRVLTDSGFICINIGDATRSFKEKFCLYPNHSLIINFFLKHGYSMLPDIHWRKQSNSPNKFMGSGMYPAGAYVTYEHEYILIFRKGGKRCFSEKEKMLRQKSAYFWEERNVWFSDLWEIKGTSQSINANNFTRNRNASFPFEIPYRLINMYSIEGDMILDPFCGLGTTNLACMASNRNSIGVDICSEIAQLALNRINVSDSWLNAITEERIKKHTRFINSLPQEQVDKCYLNVPHQFPVKTKQEVKIELPKFSKVSRNDSVLSVT